MSGGSDLIKNVKSLLFPLNLQLLKLKATYFLVYAVWMSVFPYLALMSSQIVSFQQLAITFTVIPISSVIGPIVSGFIADKLGNYKVILMGAILLGGTVHLPILWLMADRRYLEANYTRTLDESANATFEANSTDGNQLAEKYNLQYNYTFPVLLVIRIFGFFAMDTTNMLLDSCGMAMTKKFGGEFGKQKMFATCSMVIVPLICGVLIDIFSAYQGFKDYSIAFYIALGCSVAAAILIYTLDVEVTKQKGSIFKTAKLVVKMVDVDVFLIVQVVVGTCWGLHMNFFSFYVDVDLKASKTLFGAALCISGSCSVIMFWIAKPIVARFGEANTMAFGLICYACRFLAYYFLNTSWVILILEVMDGLSGFLALVAGNYFCANAAGPGGPLATFSALLFSANFGAGRTLGTTIGSSLLSTQGMRLNYLIFGVLSGSTAVIYMVIYHLVLKKVERNRLAKPSPFAQNTEGHAEQNSAAALKEEPKQTERKTEEGHVNLAFSSQNSSFQHCKKLPCTSCVAANLRIGYNGTASVYDGSLHSSACPSSNAVPFQRVKTGVQNPSFTPEQQNA